MRLKHVAIEHPTREGMRHELEFPVEGAMDDMFCPANTGKLEAMLRSYERLEKLVQGAPGKTCLHVLLISVLDGATTAVSFVLQRYMHL